jgi:fructose-1,6-bisphosphatase/inositol monophosphatase family enzyme
VDDLALAAALVRDAGQLAARMRSDGFSVERKTSISDIVTSADRAAEDLISARLRDERPDDGIIGEEGAAQPSERAGRVWHIDPIDGTYNFMSGIPIWCAALALADDDGPALGAVYHADTDELWLGGRDQPTTCNGEPVTTLPNRPLAEVSLASYLHPTKLPDASIREPWLRAVQPAATVRTFGSGSVELSWIAGGRLGGFLQYDSLSWDWLPGAALVRAAGGVAEIVRAHGHNWHLAGSRQVVDDLTGLLLRSP